MSKVGLQAAIVRFARGLPADQVDLVAQLVESAAGPNPALEAGFLAVVPNARFHERATSLTRAWRAVPEVRGETVALALRTTATAVEAERANEQVEVVWTGPPVSGIAVRYTLGVLIELISSAVERLLLVSFAAYKAKAVTDALRRASDRGVDVRLVLDGGTHADAAFTTLGDAVTVFTWPPTLLPSADPGHASLHAKSAIADRSAAFVTSANLTGFALDRNMELGLLVKGGPVPKRLAQHFDGLIAAGELTPWQASC